MRILFVSNTFPDEPEAYVSAVYQRMGMFIDALKTEGRLHFLFYVQRTIATDVASVRCFEDTLSSAWEADIELTLCPREPPPETETRWDTYAKSTLSIFRQWDYRWTSGETQVRAFKDTLSRGFDLLFVHRLRAMAPILRSGSPLPPLYFDLDDIEHVARWRNIGQPPKWPASRLAYLQLPALWWGEYRAIQLARKTFVCSEQDRRYLQRTMRQKGVATIPNAVDAREPLPVTPEPTLLFLGSMGYQPNVNAATFLIDEIWPRVRETVPKARLIIAGQDPGMVTAKRHEDESIEFPGFVADLEALYRRSRIVCTPILSGGGTRVKILEAGAFGKPVVSTRIGAEGLDLRDGQELVIRDGPESFAEACVALLTDEGVCRELGLAANKRVRALYERGHVIARIRDQIFEAPGPDG